MSMLTLATASVQNTAAAAGQEASKTTNSQTPFGYGQPKDPSDDLTVAPAVPSDDAGSVARNLISLLQDLAEGNPTQRAGVTAESDGKFPVAVQVHLPREQVLSARELDAVAGLQALGVSVTVEQREWSTAQLNALVEEVLASDLFEPYGGFYGVVTRYGINSRTNSVEIGVKHSQPELAAEATRRFGEALTVVFDDRQLVPAGRFNDTRRFYGGGRILSGNVCSWAFAWAAVGNRYAITAGHCGAIGSKWTSGGNTFGTLHNNAYNDAHPRDVALILNPSFPATGFAGRIWYGGVNTTSFAPVSQTYSSMMYDYLYFGGATSGEQLSRVEQDAGYCYTIGGRLSCDLMVAHSTNPACQGGDSGGPVYSNTGTGSLRAHGVIIGYAAEGPTWCFFLPIREVVELWNGSLVTTY